MSDDTRLSALEAALQAEKQVTEQLKQQLAATQQLLRERDTQTERGRAKERDRGKERDMGCGGDMGSGGDMDDGELEPYEDALLESMNSREDIHTVLMLLTEDVTPESSSECCVGTGIMYFFHHKPDLKMHILAYYDSLVTTEKQSLYLMVYSLKITYTLIQNLRSSLIASSASSASTPLIEFIGRPIPSDFPLLNIFHCINDVQFEESLTILYIRIYFGIICHAIMAVKLAPEGVSMKLAEVYYASFRSHCLPEPVFKSLFSSLTVVFDSILFNKITQSRSFDHQFRHFCEQYKRKFGEGLPRCTEIVDILQNKSKSVKLLSKKQIFIILQFLGVEIDQDFIAEAAADETSLTVSENPLLVVKIATTRINIVDEMHFPAILANKLQGAIDARQKQDDESSTKTV